MPDLEVKISHDDNSNQIPVIQLPANIPQPELNDFKPIERSQNLFENNGVLQIDNLFGRELVASWSEAFNQHYRAYCDDEECANSLEVGDKCRTIGLEVKSVFNDPRLYANSLLLNLMHALLGKDFIWGSFGAVIALPGAKPQQIHRNPPSLFNNEYIDTRLPSFAITVAVPLVDLTEATGSTRVWKKSHRIGRSPEPKVADAFRPLMPTGSCYLMDRRLVHGGTANNSPIIRPILYLTYYRSWFRKIVRALRNPSSRNYMQANPLSDFFDSEQRIDISPLEYQKVPDRYKFLFSGLKPTVDPSPKKVANCAFLAPFDNIDLPSQEQRLFHLAKAALKRYGLEKAEIELIAHRENTTFCIDVPGKIQKVDANPYLSDRYLLRIHRGNYLSLKDVTSELQWLQALREADLPVPEAVSTLDGELATVVRGLGIPEPRVCSLTRWVHGESEKPMNLKNIGRLMARVHSHAEQWQPPENFTRPRWDWNGLFGEGAGYSINNGDRIWQLTPQPYRHLFQAVGDRVRRAMDTIGQDPKQFGLIHGDWCPGNLLASHDEVRVIDFADCGYGYWVQDIAMFISYFSYNPEVPKYLTLLIEGYAEVRALPAKQLLYIDTFIALQQVTLALWRVNRAQDHPYFRSILPEALQQAGQHAQWFLDNCSASAS